MLDQILKSVEDRSDNKRRIDLLERTVNEAIRSENIKAIFFEHRGQTIELRNIEINQKDPHVVRLECADEDGLRVTMTTFHRYDDDDCDCNLDEYPDTVVTPPSVSSLINLCKDKLVDQLHISLKSRLHLMMARVHYVLESKNHGQHLKVLNGGRYYSVIVGDIRPKIDDSTVFLKTGREEGTDGIETWEGIIINADEWRYTKMAAIQLGPIIDFNPEEYIDELDEDFWELYPNNR